MGTSQARVPAARGRDVTAEGRAADPEDKRKHLEFIQAVITRMSAAASTAKGWLLPVVTASYGFALTQRSGSVAFLGIFAVLVFAYVDASYLRQEKAYRRLYNVVARGEKTVPAFSLNPADADEALPDADDGDPVAARRRARAARARSFLPEPAVWLSWSIAPFYGALVVLGVAVLVYAWRT